MVLRKLADRDAGPPVVTGFDDDVDTALVGQPGIEDGLAGIEPAAHLATDRLGRGHQVGVGVPGGADTLKAAAASAHVNVAAAVYQDVGHLGIVEVRGNRAEREFEQFTVERLRVHEILRRVSSCETSISADRRIAAASPRCVPAP